MTSRYTTSTTTKPRKIAFHINKQLFLTPTHSEGTVAKKLELHEFEKIRHS